MTRLQDAYRESGRKDVECPGDDLSDETLDEIWEIFAKGNRQTDAGFWWEDKPHQIAYRLVLRLTRSEDREKRLRDALNEARYALAELESAGDHAVNTKAKRARKAAEKIMKDT